MADETFAYIVLSLLAGWFLLFGLLLFRFKVYLQRDHVFWTMMTNEGRKNEGHSLPDDDGALHLKWGKFFTRPDAFHIIKPYFMSSQEKREFNFDQNSPFPIRLGHRIEMRKVHKFATNPGEVIEVDEPFYTPIPEHSVIPPPTLEVMHKQHTFSDIYQRQIGLIILLIVGFVILALIVLGLYAR